MTLVTFLLPWKPCFSAVGMSKWGSAVVGMLSGVHVNLVYLIMFFQMNRLYNKLA